MNAQTLIVLTPLERHCAICLTKREQKTTADEIISVYVVVGHRVVGLVCMWLSAIVPLVWYVCGHRPSFHWFVVGFGFLTVQERCCQNLQLTLLCSFVVGETIAKIIPHRPRLATLQDSKVRHHTPLFPYDVRILHNLARHLPFERDTVGNMQIFAYQQPYLF